MHLGTALLANLHPTASMALMWALSELMLQAAEPPIVMPFFTGVPRYIPGPVD